MLPPFLLNRYIKSKLSDKPVEALLPPKSFAGKAILAAKPYLEKAKSNPAAGAVISTMPMLIKMAEGIPEFQEGFAAWFEDVKKIEAASQPTEIQGLVEAAKAASKDATNALKERDNKRPAE